MRRGATGSLRPPGDDPTASLITTSFPRSRNQHSRRKRRPPKYRRRARREVTQGTAPGVIRPGGGVRPGGVSPFRDENTSGGERPRRRAWHAGPMAHWHFGSPSLLAGVSDVDPM